MSTVSELLCGSAEPLPERVALRAGPLALVFEAGDLRSVCLGDVEVVNRIYGAVRDGEWETIPGQLRDLRIDAGAGGFHIHYVSEHVAGHVDFVWRATITGTPEGTITFRFEGTARTAFARNRIGLCVLHPLATCAGRPAIARTSSGGTRDLVFPREVASEQPIAGFHALTGLRWPVARGTSVDLTFEGDLFETEDQRNWIDASFKTYGTPLALPRPVLIPAGSRVDQRVVLRMCRDPAVVEPAPVAASPVGASERATAPTHRVAPRIGLGLSAELLSRTAESRLRTLQPAHLRVDLVLPGPWQPRLQQALRLAEAIGCGLELALHLATAPADALRRLADLLPDAPAVDRILVFDAAALVTTQAALDAVREHLVHRYRVPVPLGSGSARDLYQLHLSAPPPADLTCWGMHPQAHATDLTSIAETPVAARDQVRTVRSRRPGQIAISPVQLHPSAPDPRQTSLFCAAWTLAVLAQLTVAGADSITVFETIGERGVMVEQAVFPMFHVLADLAELSDGLGRATLLPTTSDVTALLLPDALLLANLSRHSRDMPLPRGFDACTSRLLDADTARHATRSPDTFRRTDTPVTGGQFTLPPFATARLDRRAE